MDPFWGNAVETAGGLLASAVNVFQARENRRWQERLANTAHQREVADLRAAGLNPILSATGGKGAAVPSGGAAVVDNPFQGVANSAVSRARLSMEKELQAATLQKMGLENVNAAKQGRLLDMQAWLTGANARLAELSGPEADSKAQLWRVLGNTVNRLLGSRGIESDLGTVLEKLGFANPFVGERGIKWEGPANAHQGGPVFDPSKAGVRKSHVSPGGLPPGAVRTW